MQRQDYLNAIGEHMYQGEVLGEAVFARFLALEKDPERRYKWGTLMQLETETKARLRPFLTRLGIPIEEADVAARVEEFSKDYNSKSWAEQMQTIAEVTSYYLERFREIEAAAPPTEREVAHSMIVHEQALHDFAKKELAGDAKHSLRDVIEQLKYPLALATG